MFRKILVFILSVYVIAGALLYFFQKKLIFHPKTLPANYVFKYDAPFQEINLKINEKELINAILFKASRPKGIVIYFHGNAQNISFYAAASGNFTRNGYDVLMMDYPEYGKSTGALKEEVLYADALHMYELARSRFSPDSIIIYGRSLGTAIASELASVRDCKRLILEAPYYNMTDMAMHLAPVYPYGLMLDYKFPTNEFLKKVTAPVTIIHGTNDHTVPYASGKKLEKEFKRGDQFVTIPGADHNDLSHFPMFGQTLDSLLR